VAVKAVCEARECRRRNEPPRRRRCGSDAGASAAGG
jgi:hypothetical protein